MTNPSENLDQPQSSTSVRFRRAREGSVEDLGWLVDRLQPLMLVHARWRLGPVLRQHYDPEDLVQDAWACALPRLRELPDRDGHHTAVLVRFLSTTILNRTNNLIRKHIRDIRTHGATPSPGHHDDPLSKLPADITGACTAVAQRERNDAVRSAIEALGDLDREVLLLRGVEQRTNAEVASTLRIDPDAATMRYSRALKRLRAQLPKSLFDELPES